MASKISKKDQQILRAAQGFDEETPFSAKDLADAFNAANHDHMTANSMGNELDDLIKKGFVNAPVYTLTAAGRESVGE